MSEEKRLTVAQPTPVDFMRDLLADLALCDNVPQCWYTLLDIQDTKRDEERDAWLLCVQFAAPAAIRRALAAEAFKAWVHGWLDAIGVPHDPDPVHTAENGCRISGRMRFLLQRVTTAEAEVERLTALIHSE